MAAKRRDLVKIYARVTLSGGILASIAANVISADPTALGRVVAAWPALALLASIHLFQHAKRGWLVRLAIGAVAGVAAWISYWHMVEVATMAGEGYVTAHIIPASVDGLMYLATVVLTTTRPKPVQSTRVRKAVAPRTASAPASVRKRQPAVAPSPAPALAAP